MIKGGEQQHSSSAQYPGWLTHPSRDSNPASSGMPVHPSLCSQSLRLPLRQPNSQIRGWVLTSDSQIVQLFSQTHQLSNQSRICLTHSCDRSGVIFKVGSQCPFPIPAHKVWENHPTALCKSLSENWQMQFDHTVITELYLRSQQRGLLIVSLNISSVALSCKPRSSFSSLLLSCHCCAPALRLSILSTGKETRAGRYTPRTAAGESSKWHIWNLCILMSVKTAQAFGCYFLTDSCIWFLCLRAICMWELHLQELAEFFPRGKFLGQSLGQRQKSINHAGAGGSLLAEKKPPASPLTSLTFIKFSLCGCCLQSHFPDSLQLVFSPKNYTNKLNKFEIISRL